MHIRPDVNGTRADGVWKTVCLDSVGCKEYKNRSCR